MELKTTSSDFVIQQVLDSYPISDSAWVNSAKDWIVSGVRFIGKHVGLNTKICQDVYVEDYHANYPIDMEGILAVMYKGRYLPLGSDLSGIGMVRKFDAQKASTLTIMENDTLLDINSLKARQTELINQYSTTPTQQIAELINDISNKINALETYVSAANQVQNGRGATNNGQDFFNTKMGCLQTSFPTGYIDIIYSAFPVDNKGFLMVIDQEDYLHALEMFIILKLVTKGYKIPNFEYRYVYDKFHGNKAAGEPGLKNIAANKVRIPSLVEAERFTRMYEQMKFRRDLPQMLFNKTEQIYGLTW